MHRLFSSSLILALYLFSVAFAESSSPSVYFQELLDLKATDETVKKMISKDTTDLTRVALNFLSLYKYLYNGKSEEELEEAPPFTIDDMFGAFRNGAFFVTPQQMPKLYKSINDLAVKLGGVDSPLVFILSEDVAGRYYNASSHKITLGDTQLPPVIIIGEHLLEDSEAALEGAVATRLATYSESYRVRKRNLDILRRSISLASVLLPIFASYRFARGLNNDNRMVLVALTALASTGVGLFGITGVKAKISRTMVDEADLIAVKTLRSSLGLRRFLEKKVSYYDRYKGDLDFVKSQMAGVNLVEKSRQHLDDYIERIDQMFTVLKESFDNDPLRFYPSDLERIQRLKTFEIEQAKENALAEYKKEDTPDHSE